jgi:ABC-2 type transport system permease protein
MKNITTIAAKELKSYFISPIAYVIATVFLIITGYFFYSGLSVYSLQCFDMMRFSKAIENMNINIRVFQNNFGAMITTIMFMMPIITMRIFAEEKKNKTIELLMTSPVSISEIVLGKFLASFILFAGMVLLTIYMPIYASIYTDLDWGAIWASYIGILLVGSVFLSIGIFASSLTENQIVAALISFAFILIFVMIDWIAGMSEGKIAIVLSYLSLSKHLANFFRGVINTKDVVYYLSFIFLGLFMTFRGLESKKWI